MPLRAYTDRENATGRARTEKSLLAAIFLAQAMFCYAEGNAGILLASVLAMGGSWLAAHYRREIYLRRMTINAAVLVLGIALVWRFFALNQMLLLALGHYVMLIQICKLFERKGNRDYVQMIVMSLLLVLAAAMMTQELAFGLMLAAYLVQMSKAVMSLTVKRSLDAACRGTTGGPGAASRWPGRAITAWLTVVMLAMGMASIGAFLAVPRGMGSRAGAVRNSGQSGAGFPEDVRLGQKRSIYLSDRIVMQVRMKTGAGADLGPVGGMYLRSRSYQRYHGSRWEATGLDIIRTIPAKERRLLGDCIRQEITMVPDLLPAAFATYPALRIEEPQGAAVTPSRDHEYELRTPGLRRDLPVRYVALVLPPGHRERASIGNPDEDPSWRGSTRLGSKLPPRVRELARQWCEDLLAQRESSSADERDRLDLAIAYRIAGRLGERCSYTLDLTGANPNYDGVEDFLFHLRRGHCEYFASAMTVMCQDLGVRARLSTGFAGGEYDPGSGSYKIRQRDAHAWTEVYTDRDGWVVVDATPGERFEEEPSTAPGRVYAWIRDVWRSWEFAWFSHVVGYDDRARRDLAGQVKQSYADLTGWAERMARDVRQGLIELFAKGRFNPEAAWFFLVAGALALLVAALTYFRRGGSRRRSRSRSPVAPRPPAFMAQLIKLLTRHGAPLGANQTLRQWSRQATARLGLPAGQLDGLIDLHERVRWSGRGVPREQLEQAEDRVRGLQEMLST